MRSGRSPAARRWAITIIRVSSMAASGSGMPTSSQRSQRTVARVLALDGSVLIGSRWVWISQASG